MSEHEQAVSGIEVSEPAVFADIVGMLATMLEEYGVEADEITMDTQFHDDLEMESIDLVALSGLLRERYGEQVNFAEFIASLELEQIMRVTVGELVRFVVRSLKRPAEAAGEPLQ
jgi:acyl carrier protein